MDAGATGIDYFYNFIMSSCFIDLSVLSMILGEQKGVSIAVCTAESAELLKDSNR